MSVLKSGLTLGFGLIISMGPQNIFLIRQGLKKEYAFLAALVCSVCDMTLVLLSTLSISELIFIYPTAKMILVALGALFLITFGAKSIYSGLKQMKNKNEFTLNFSTKPMSKTKVFLTAISFSLLNPQAIIDTMLTIGGIVSHYPQEDQLVFVIGVIAASFLWFTGITSLSSSCANYLSSGRIWGVLELTSGFIMLCFSLVLLSKI